MVVTGARPVLLGLTRDAVATQVPVWGACGGLSSTKGHQNAADPAHCCAGGSTCTYVNDHYWQCLPSSAAADNLELQGAATAGSPAGTSAAGPSTGSSGAALNMWDQCGGMGGNCQSYGCADAPYSGASCPAGTSSCSRLSEWYFQCLPTTSQQHGGSQQTGQAATPGSSSGAFTLCSLPNFGLVGRSEPRLRLRRACNCATTQRACLLLLRTPGCRRRQQLILIRLGLLGHHQAGAARQAGPWAGPGAGVLQGIARARRLPACAERACHGRRPGAGPGCRGACAVAGLHWCIGRLW